MVVVLINQSDAAGKALPAPPSQNCRGQGDEKLSEQETSDVVRKTNDTDSTSPAAAPSEVHHHLAALFDDFMNFGSVGLHIVDNQGIILWANQAELDLLGYTPDEYFGKPIADFHCSSEKINEILSILLSGRKIKNYIAPIRCKDGHTEYLEINSSMRIINGELTTTRCFSVPVTDRVLRQQAQLQALQQQQEAALIRQETQKKTRFLRQLCHELRNPLSGVSGNLDLLMAELQELEGLLTSSMNPSVVSPTCTSHRCDDPAVTVNHAAADSADRTRGTAENEELHLTGAEQTSSSRNAAAVHIQRALECCEAAQIAAEHQTLVINDTLSLSKLDRDDFEFTPKPVDLALVLKSVVAILGTKAQEKSINVQVDLKEETGARFLKTDVVWLKQVLLNLLSNALKFTNDGGRVQVVISASQNRRNKNVRILQLAVADTGIGMTPDEQKRLFRVFSQANDKISSQFGGSGLGLHIVKQLMENIGGNVQVQSEKGVGTTFTVRMPCQTLSESELGALVSGGGGAALSSGAVAARSGRRASHPQHDPTTLATPQSPSAIRQTPRRLHVLVVDDSQINRRILTRYLTKSGHTCAEAENGRQALDLLLQEQQFDIVLSDVEMPVMDGHELTRRIRRFEARNEQRQMIPIIGISGNVLPEDVEAAKKLGMNDYIGKPFKFPQVEEMLQRYTAPATNGSREPRRVRSA